MSNQITWNERTTNYKVSVLLARQQKGKLNKPTFNHMHKYSSKENGSIPNIKLNICMCVKELICVEWSSSFLVCSATDLAEYLENN